LDATSTPGVTSTPEPTPPVSVVALEEMGGMWLAWDVTALLRAWLAGDAPDHGLALAAFPEPDAGPEEAGDRLVARWIAVDDPETRPYLIVDTVVHPVTPTPAPTPTPVTILPSAGGSPGWALTGLAVVALGALALLLAVRPRR
jgi:hypothetical protein